MKRYKQTALKLVSLAVTTAGLSRLLKNKITVIMYHGVRPDRSPFHSWMLVSESSFERQIQFLSRHFDLISIDQAVSGPPYGVGKRPAAIITFDDGMKNNVEYAWPILQRYGAPATLYVSTEAMTLRQPFWWDRVIASVQTSGRCEVCLNQYGLGTYNFNTHREPEYFWRHMSKLLEDIKRLPDGLLAEVVEVIAMQAGGQTNENRVFDPIDPNDIRQLSSDPLMRIGSHGHRHCLLTEITLDEARQNVKQSLERLTLLCRQPIQHFSYPNGNYNEAVIGMLKDLGFVSAVTTSSGRWGLSTDPYRIPRIRIGAYDDMQVFRLKLSLPDRLLALFNW
jgi:peptidoglycan/xylan/chitin deacetylase (PgdA/CDA1 family)